MKDKFSRASRQCAVFTLMLAVSVSQALAEPYQLGVQEKTYIDSSQAYPAYPSYPSYPSSGLNRLDVNPGTTLHGATGQNQQVKKKVVLPPSFLGVWSVQGQRTKIGAANDPKYQQGVQRVFAGMTQNTWTIKGNANSGYSLTSDQGITTPLVVENVQGNTAYIKYQHPVYSTMAMEAIVLQLGGNGASFEGLENISIVKAGEKPRMWATYQLQATKQR